MWEVDVQLTRDGHPILMHDETLARTTDAPTRFPEREPWRVRDLTWEEVAQLDAGSWFSATTHGVADPGEDYRGEGVPCLGDALAFTHERSWRINLELKLPSNRASTAVMSSGRTLLDRTIQAIRRLGMDDRVIVSSLQQSLVTMLKHQSSEIRAALVTEGPWQTALHQWRRLGADACHLRLDRFDERVAKKFRQAGCDVYVWTVNDAETMRTLIAQGVDGIITDHPHRLNAILWEACRGTSNG